MRSLLVLLFIFIAFINEGFGQRSCGFNEQLKLAEQTDPAVAIKRNNFEKEFSSFKAALSAGRISIPDTIFIPVVVHVLWHEAEENIIDSQVLSQIRILNEDFNGLNPDRANTPAFFKPLRGKTHFFFQLAKQDPNGLPTNGIDRQYTFRKNGFGLDGVVNITALGGCDAWDPRYYVNIWCCNMEQASGTFAATYFPGGSLLRDGIQCDYHYMGTGGVTQPPYNLGRTITHEMGHYFNLDHTWGPSDVTFVPFCGDDDHVEDTPPQGKANYYCPQFPKSSCGNYSDMFMNFMDYTDDGCMNMFSKGQVERMWAAWYIMTPLLRYSKALVQPKLYAHDAGVQAILEPNENSFGCDKRIRPVIIVRNYGTDTLKRVSILYGIAEKMIGSNVIEYLQIPPLSRDTIEAGWIDIEGNGPADLFAATVIPGGLDENPFNDTARVVYNRNNGPGMGLPFYEDFSHHFFPPAGWSVLNPDRLFTWTPTNGSQLSGYAPSIMMDNIEYPFKGEKDMLVTPPLNLSGSNSPRLIFSHAFQLFSNDFISSDTLEVSVSLDCGQSWQRVFYKGGRELATKRPPTRAYFSPDKESDWKKDTIDLTPFKGITNLLVAFVNINGSDNLLYLDNIAVTDGAAIITRQPASLLLPLSAASY